VAEIPWLMQGAAQVGRLPTEGWQVTKVMVLARGEMNNSLCVERNRRRRRSELCISIYSGVSPTNLPKYLNSILLTIL
jgi:hypothetical protein